jgi:hypothetical protein
MWLAPIVDLLRHATEEVIVGRIRTWYDFAYSYDI